MPAPATPAAPRPRVVVVGGGLAGLAAAAGLAPRGCEVTVLESRPRLGGRASSFLDRTTGERVDNCQHVAMGCCTNFLGLCADAGLSHLLREQGELTFLLPDGTASTLSESRPRGRTLPAPLHLAASFARLRHFTLGEKRRLAAGVRALGRGRGGEDEDFAAWLAAHGQTERLIARFWHPVLVSALSETPDRIAVAAARKVIADGFLAHPAAWRVFVPTVPLDVLYGEGLLGWLRSLGVTVRTGAGVKRVEVAAPQAGEPQTGEPQTGEPHTGEPHTGETTNHTRLTPTRSVSEERRAQPGAVAGLHTAAAPRSSLTLRVGAGTAPGPRVVLRDGSAWTADHVVLAVPHHRAAALCPDDFARVAGLTAAQALETAPISSVHVWFDREITPLPHAVLPERTSQWVFNRTRLYEVGAAKSEVGSDGWYFQVVISASQSLAGRPSGEVIEEVLGELRAAFPAARDAEVRHARMVTEHRAVFAPLPGHRRLRPSSRTPDPRVHLAGDWTNTGWPATMEGAVRSGYLAAESVLRGEGRPEAVVKPDLPAGRLTRWLGFA